MTDKHIASALPPTAEKFIEQAYAELQKQPDFKMREGQRALSQSVCISLLTKKPLAAEAPTGTGKTLAYLIGALAAKAELQNVTDPVVIATATKALQAQLMSSDLPKLVAAGMLSPHDVALAKGKSNYLCQRDAQEVSRLGVSILAADSEDEEADETANIDPEQVQLMLDALAADEWDGDFDAYMGPKPGALDRIKVKSETCTGKKCGNYGTCAYFKAKAQMSQAQLIVANHDLVLADLQMASEDGAEAYFPAARYMLVVDEAHNFPAKAISVGQKNVNVVDALNRVFRLRALVTALERHKELAAILVRASVTRSDFEAKPLVTAFQGLLEELQAIEVDAETGQLRFSKGLVPTSLFAAADAVVLQFGPVNLSVQNLLLVMREFNPPEHVAVRKSFAEAMHIAVQASLAMKRAFEGLVAFTGKHRAVRWVSNFDGRLSVHTSPLEGADVLKPILWESHRASPAFVSATLRDLNGFDGFKRSAGMPANSTTQVLPYIFPYAESQVVVVAMNATPKQAERKEYMQELKQKLPMHIRPKEATLVLCPSRVMLRDLAPLLKTRFGEDAVLVQGDSSIKGLLEKHRRRVATGQVSILVGMATMAEGLDLPGKLCEHVVILTLPFAVPTEPVEQELAEMLGPKYFGQRSLPDAMTRLLQMVGRLLRRETDRGRITCFDRRLASTSYGRQMLAALPPFKKVIEPMAN
jgi:ATP-dependent DNA helicase DinG